MAFPSKVRIGSPFTGFPAASFNALVDGHDAQKAHKTQQTNPRFGPFTQNPRLVVRVLNSLSSDIGPGEILGFSEPLVTLSSDANQVYGIPAVKGITPAVPEHSNQFVVALDGIQGTTSTGTTGAIGPAVLMGLAWCKVNWTDDAHDKVVVVEGETQLQSGTSGITPVYHDTIPGELPADVWALVLLGGGGGTVTESPTRYGRVVVAIPAATNTRAAGWAVVEAAVSLTDETTGEEIDPDNPITVTNKKRIRYEVGCQVTLNGVFVENGDCFPAPDAFWDPVPEE